MKPLATQFRPTQVQTSPQTCSWNIALGYKVLDLIDQTEKENQ
jgi:hypothetical protein